MRRSIFVALALVLAAPLFAATLGSAPMNVDGLTLDLISVERKGNVLTVKWSIRNDGKDRKRIDLDLAGDRATSYVVDEENGAKYFTLTDRDGVLLATEHEYDGIYEEVEPGQTKRFWAKYPAPPPAVKSVNILFTDTEPFESIAITDK
jgi:hypothetical protein